MSTVSTKLQGLSDEEVIRSRQQHGENMLTPPEKESIWKLYLEKFKDPVIKVLLFAAVLSLGISIIENEYAETIGIIFAILLATGIGFYFEYDAGKKFDLLNAVGEETQVKVIRGGKVHSIPRREVVVGDIVNIENGEEIPADGELLEATSLQINESSLTGELMVEKTINTLDAYMEVLNAQCEAEYTDELKNKILALARLTNKWIAASGEQSDTKYYDI